MNGHAQIQEWLDLWEMAAPSGRTADLDEFVSTNCRNATPGQVERFREATRRLNSINRLIEQMLVTEL